MNKISRRLFVLAVAIEAVAFNTQAAAIIVPPGLVPGGAYRIVFVTNNQLPATSAIIADYNTFVTNQANGDLGLQSLGTTWTALASTSAVNVLTNTGLAPGDATTPFYNTLGDLIATGVTVLGSGLYGGPTTSHSAQISNQFGGPGLANVWTGTQSDGSTHTTGPLGSALPTFGYNISTDTDWTDDGPGLASSTQFAIYGVSGPLTVPSSTIPEPGSMALSGVGAAALLLLAKFRQARN